MILHLNRGFTLVELLAAITIVAVISAVAVPLYTQYSQRSFRVEAQADLMDCAQAMERWSAINFSYLGAADTDGDGAADGDDGAVSDDICRPNSVDLNRYDIDIAATATTFTLTATPVANGPMDGDGFVSVDNAGNRVWDEDDDDAVEAGEDNWHEG